MWGIMAARLTVPPPPTPEMVLMTRIDHDFNGRGYPRVARRLFIARSLDFTACLWRTKKHQTPFPNSSLHFPNSQSDCGTRRNAIPVESAGLDPRYGNTSITLLRLSDALKLRLRTVNSER